MHTRVYYGVISHVFYFILFWFFDGKWLLFPLIFGVWVSGFPGLRFYFDCGLFGVKVCHLNMSNLAGTELILPCPVLYGITWSEPPIEYIFK